jgi:hypothetical protein
MSLHHLKYGASSKRHCDTVDAMIEWFCYLGADVNARDDLGKTPLMYAAEQNAGVGVLLTLLKNGAKPDVRDAKGRTSLHYAVNPDQHELLRRWQTLPVCICIHRACSIQTAADTVRHGITAQSLSLMLSTRGEALPELEIQPISTEEGHTRAAALLQHVIHKLCPHVRRMLYSLVDGDEPLHPSVTRESMMRVVPHSCSPSSA